MLDIVKSSTIPYEINSIPCISSPYQWNHLACFMFTYERPLLVKSASTSKAKVEAKGNYNLQLKVRFLVGA